MNSFAEFFLHFFRDLPQELSLARVIESLVVLYFLWAKLKPYLKNIEGKFQDIENTMKNSFLLQNERFIKIENRINILEEKGET